MTFFFNMEVSKSIGRILSNILFEFEDVLFIIHSHLINAATTHYYFKKYDTTHSCDFFSNSLLKVISIKYLIIISML